MANANPEADHEASMFSRINRSAKACIPQVSAATESRGGAMDTTQIVIETRACVMGIHQKPNPAPLTFISLQF